VGDDAGDGDGAADDDGAGLGLAIVDALVRAQGGTARVANAAGGGGLAAIMLPLA
jgi:K+-sensing histidine kinase KdpD